MTERLRRAGARLAPAAALLMLLAPTWAGPASSAAPAARADVSAGSQTAGASTRVGVVVRPGVPLRRATVSVALPEGWPSFRSGTVRLDADGCRTGAARVSQDRLAVSRLTCAAGASIELSAAGRLPAKAGRYHLTTTIADRTGSRTTRAPFTVEAGKAHHLVVTPSSATMTYGGTRAFRAYAEDAYGNRREEVTDRASFSLSPGGACAGPVCGAGAHAGTHAVTADLGELSGFAELTVEPRHVTVSAVPATKVYGAPDPALTYTVDRLAGSATGLAGVTCAVSGVHTKVGEYPVTCAGASDPDYVVDRYVPGMLRVTPASLDVRVSGTQTYGGAPSYAVDQITGLVNGDTAGVVSGALSCRTTATTGSGVGWYPISGCTGLSSPNYAIGYSYGSVRVTPRPVTVRADAKTKTAGQPDPVFTYTTVPAGLRLAGVTCSVSPAHSGAGVYPITCSTTTDPNYAQTSVPGTLTVTAASLVVRVTGTQTYGGAPTYVPTITSGLVGGDTSAVLRGSLTCATTATATSAVGSYAISGCSGLSATGYTVAYEYGSMQVTRRPLHVKVSGTQVYGGAPTYTRTVVSADLVNGDTAAVVTGSLTCVTAATPTSDVATYVVSGCSGLSASNYAIEYELGALEVTPRPVSVRAADATKSARAPDPAFTYSTVPAGIALDGVTCSVAGAHDAAGSYEITCSETTDPNYDQTTVPGTLAVAAVCGDAVKEGVEACDDGNTATESGSCPYGQATCAPACSASCDAVVTRSSGGTCGDGAKQPEEFCDDGNTVSESSCPYGSATCNACNSTCSGTLSLTGGFCGDGTKQPQEACDDGNATDETSCPYGSASCVTCNASCTGTLSLTGAVCGDGTKQPEEVCDDGNRTSETSCPYGSATCMACDAGCSSTLSLTGPYCGDGVRQAGEACDDGNGDNADTCTTVCQPGPG